MLVLYNNYQSALLCPADLTLYRLNLTLSNGHSFHLMPDEERKERNRTEKDQYWSVLCSKALISWLW